MTTTPKNILIVTTTGLGDSLLVTPAIEMLREAFPDARIDMLCHQRWLDLFRYCTKLDTCYTFRNNKFIQWRLRRMMKKIHYDIISIAHANDPVFDFCATLNYGEMLNTQEKDKPEIRLRPIEASYEIHAAARRSVQAQSIIGEYAKVSDPGKLLLYLNNPRHLPFPNKKKNVKRIIIQAGAANDFKMWPPEYFGETLKKLAGRHCLDVYVIGGLSDAKRYKAIKKHSGLNIHNATNNDLITNCHLIKSADLMLTNDTGPMHIAHALNTPTVSLWCMTNHLTIGPYNPNPRFITLHKPPPADIPKRKEDRSNECMKQITVDEVLDACETLFAQAAQDDTCEA